MTLNGSAGHPQACEALSSMLSRNTLNPADINVLFKNYSSTVPPPIDLIRNPQFLDLLVDSLFKSGVKINQEHKSKYIYLLAYASSVSESHQKGNKNGGGNQLGKRNLNKEELKSTISAIEKVHAVCNVNKVGVKTFSIYNRDFCFSRILRSTFIFDIFMTFLIFRDPLN